MKMFLLCTFVVLAPAAFSQNNVGIGTSSPTLGRLDVRGANGTTLLNLSADASTPGLAVFNPAGSPSLGYNVRMSGTNYVRMGVGHGSMWQYLPASGSLHFYSTVASGGAGNTAAFTHRLTISGTGNLGIGIGQPKAHLHTSTLLVGSQEAVPATGYLLAVGGKLICEEARIQLHGNWPDYVFSTHYKLPSLAELETFIRSNRHLPNMPSAADVQKANGVDVGDMQKRLLEKVEELTLYILQLKKENEALQNRVEALEKQ